MNDDDAIGVQLIYRMQSQVDNYTKQLKKTSLELNLRCQLFFLISSINRFALTF